MAYSSRAPLCRPCPRESSASRSFRRERLQDRFHAGKVQAEGTSHVFSLRVLHIRSVLPIFAFYVFSYDHYFSNGLPRSALDYSYYDYVSPLNIASGMLR